MLADGIYYYYPNISKQLAHLADKYRGVSLGNIPYHSAHYFAPANPYVEPTPCRPYLLDTDTRQLNSDVYVVLALEHLHTEQMGLKTIVSVHKTISILHVPDTHVPDRLGTNYIGHCWTTALMEPRQVLAFYVYDKL